MHRVLLVIDDYSELVYLQTLLKKVGFDVDGIQNSRKFDEKRLTMNPELVIATAKSKNVNGLSLAEKMKRRGGKPKNILLIPQTMAKKLQGLKFKNVEATLISPVDPLALLETLSDILGVDKEALIDKYEKMKTSLDPDNENDIQLLKQVELPKAGPERPAPEEPETVFYGPGSEEDMPSEFAEEVQSNVKDQAAAELEEAETSGLSAEAPEGKFKFEKQSSLTDEDRNQRMQAIIDSMETPEHDGFSREVVARENTRLRQEEDKESLKDLEEERQAFVKAMFED